MDRRVADDAVVRPPLAGLELGLDERRRSAPRRRERRGDRARTRSSEMNETSIDGQRDAAPAAWSAVSVAGVGALHRDHPGIAAERLGELAATHVESVDAASRRAATGRR